jgi:hypothetical protein
MEALFNLFLKEKLYLCKHLSARQLDPIDKHSIPGDDRDHQSN